MTSHATFTALGRVFPQNVYGRASALLDMLYRDGQLPDCHAYGVDEAEADRAGQAPGVLYVGIGIGGEPAGVTDAEVTTFIWRMAETYREHGYLFA